MSDTALTSDEKRCLQMWFRQAIVQLEREEACANIAHFYGGGETKPREGHHAPVGTRRKGRTARPQHKELV